MIIDLKEKTSLITIFVFLLLNVLGFCLANHRPLWVDEYHTGEVPHSYQTIWTGKVPAEANNCPLFYTLEKFIVGLFPALPIEDVQYRIVLRILSIVSISLSLTIAFRYFVSRFSLWVGIYFILIAMSSWSLILYWIEARVYAMWMALTLIESLCFIELMQKGFNRDIWIKLTIIHVLLALTIISSLPYILTLSVLLWVFVEKRFQYYLGLTLVPILIALFYYTQAEHFRLSLYQAYPFLTLLSSNFPKERILFFVVVFFVSAAVYIKQKNVSSVMISLVKSATPHIWLVAAMLITHVLFLKAMTLHQTEGYSPILTRHFVNISPVGVLAMTVFPILLYKFFYNQRAVQVLICLVVVALASYRFYLTWTSFNGIFIFS